MARLIPNQATRVYFAAAVADADLNPAAAEISGAEDVTAFLVTLDASARGNTVPTPDFESLFETSIPGTSTATFTAEFYRDDTTDTAWDALPRNTEGYFIISRFGGTGAGGLPVATDEVEVWPVRITTRAALPLTNNESQRFSVEAAVPVEPNEAATVSA